MACLGLGLFCFRASNEALNMTKTKCVLLPLVSMRQPANRVGFISAQGRGEESLDLAGPLFKP